MDMLSLLEIHFSGFLFITALREPLNIFMACSILSSSLDSGSLSGSLSVAEMVLMPSKEDIVTEVSHHGKEVIDRVLKVVFNIISVQWMMHRTRSPRNSWVNCLFCHFSWKPLRLSGRTFHELWVLATHLSVEPNVLFVKILKHAFILCNLVTEKIA